MLALDHWYFEVTSQQIIVGVLIVGAVCAISLWLDAKKRRAAKASKNKR